MLTAGITEILIQGAIKEALTPQLTKMYQGIQIGAPSPGELAKIATSVAAGAATGIQSQVVGPIQSDIDKIKTAVNKLIDAIEDLKNFSGLGYSVPAKLD